MNAVLKTKPTQPRSAASLRAEISRLETQLAEVRRTENATRAARPTILADGDEDAIRLANQTVEECGARIKGLLEELGTTQSAHEIAAAREAQAARAQTYLKLKTAIDVTRADVDEVQECAVKFVLAYRKAAKGVTALHDQLSRAEIEPDPLWLKAKLQGVTELCLYVESEGLFGRGSTIESPEQMRRNGRASLQALAKAFHSLALDAVKGALRVRD